MRTGKYSFTKKALPIISIKYCLPVIVFHVWPSLTHPALQRGLSALAELLVIVVLFLYFLQIISKRSEMQNTGLITDKEVNMLTYE